MESAELRAGRKSRAPARSPRSTLDTDRNKERRFSLFRYRFYRISNRFVKHFLRKFPQLGVKFCREIGPMLPKAPTRDRIPVVRQAKTDRLGWVPCSTLAWACGVVTTRQHAHASVGHGARQFQVGEPLARGASEGRLGSVSLAFASGWYQMPLRGGIAAARELAQPAAR